MTKPIPMYTQDKSRNFGHAIVGYYSDGHKWVPVTVNQDGHLLFKQDPDTAAAITAFAASIEALVEYVHDSMDDMQTAQEEFLAQANTDFQNNFDSMKAEVLSIENTFKTDLENMFQQEMSAIDTVFNTSIGNLNTSIGNLDSSISNASDVLSQFQTTLNAFDNKVALFNDTVDEFDSAVDRLNETLDDFISMSEEEISTVVNTAFSPLSDSEINEIVQEGWE